MTDPLHILFDARMVHYRQAGIGQYAVSLLRAMAESDALGPEDRVDMLQMAGHTRPIVGDPRFHRVASRIPPHNRFEQAALPAELMRLRRRPQIMHCPDFVPPRLRPFPAVVNIQDLAFLKFPDLALLTGESKRYYEQVHWAARNADALIALSESARDDIVHLLGVKRGKVAVIPAAASTRFRPPADPQQARVTADSRFGLGPNDGGYILFVGTIEPRKNLTTLLDAYSLLKARGSVNPMPVLAVIGQQGWLFEQVYARVETLGLQDQVYFLHGVEDKSLPLFYTGARLFALPSIYEGFGIPALEALASGTPVVSSNGGSLPEVVGGAGILLDARDTNAWADALERVLLDPDLDARLRREGPVQASRFSWARSAGETVALYRKVLAHKRRSASIS
jgi:glycosyltransferase involved in cell wall biosynthesis